MKNLLELKGMKVLSKTEQANLNGGARIEYFTVYCADGYGMSYPIENLAYANGDHQCIGHGGFDYVETIESN